MISLWRRQNRVVGEPNVEPSGPQLFWESQWVDNLQVVRRDFKQRRFKMTVESVRYRRVENELHCEVVLIAEFVLREGETMRKADIPLASFLLQQHILDIREYFPDEDQSYHQNENMPPISLSPSRNPDPPPQLTWKFTGHRGVDCPKTRFLITVCKTPAEGQSFPFTIRLYRMKVKVHHKHWRTGWSELTARDFPDHWKFTITQDYNADVAAIPPIAGFVVDPSE